MLMKGSLHTDELMAAVVKRETGLRTSRRVSHCFIMDVPAIDRVADHHRRGGEHLPDAGGQGRTSCRTRSTSRMRWAWRKPKVAILSAMETVNPKVPSTIEAAALCKMAERGQITGGLLDGPLALDNAIDLGAAKIKKIASPVAGQADILVVPDLEAGNMLAKSLSFMADADAAGIVLGARVPVILTSRADSVPTRLASCAVAALVAKARREDLQEGGGVMSRRNRGSQRGLVEHQVLAVRANRRRPRARCCAARPRPSTPRRASSPRTRPARRSRRHDLGRRHPARPRRCAAAHRGLRAGAGSASSQPRGHRAPRRARRARSTRSRCASTRKVLDDLAQFVPLAPLHQPHNLTPIRLLLERRPELPQVACFDTAFHRAQPELAQMFALPRELHDAGVRRYGFHGLSYEYIASVLPQLDAEGGERPHAWSCTWATAPACARCPPAAASPARWASPRSTGCRWAPAAAPSTRASSCT